MTFSKLCTPAKVYLVLALIEILYALFYGASLLAEIIMLLFAILWTIFLSWICSKGHVAVSWALVLLPYILLFIFHMLVALEVKKVKSTKNK
jgi:hypothetical protein